MISLDEADRLARAGALWAIPGVATHWLRVWDGVGVRVARYGEVAPRCAGWSGGSWTLAVGGSRRGLARLYELALGVGVGAGVWPRGLAGPKWPDVFGALDAQGISEILAPEVAPD